MNVEIIKHIDSLNVTISVNAEVKTDHDATQIARRLIAIVRELSADKRVAM